MRLSYYDEDEFNKYKKELEHKNKNLCVKINIALVAIRNSNKERIKETLCFLQSKKINGQYGIYELKISKERLFYIFKDDCIVIIHSCRKDSQKIHSKEMDLLIKRVKDLKN